MPLSPEAMNQAVQKYRAYLATLTAIHVDPRLRAKFGLSDVVQNTLLEAFRQVERIEALDSEEKRRWLRCMLVNNLREEIKRTLKASVGFLLSRDAFRRFKTRLDYSEYGGAPLLGVKGCVIICHGRSSAKAVKNAIRLAAEFSRQSLAQKIQASIAELHSHEARAVQG